MNWDILIPESIDSSGLNLLAEMACFTRYGAYDSQESLLADVGVFDAVIVRGSLEVSREFIEAATNLKVLSKHGVGLDTIDIPAASERGIIVSNTPGANSHAVAEHTIGLLFSLKKNIAGADRTIRRDGWKRNEYQSTELRNCTLGLYGCGNIGEKVGQIATSLGMDVLAYDPYLSEYRLPAGIQCVESLEELLQSINILSVHAPLTDETRGAISTNQLRMLQDDSYVLNTSRGEIIDEAALVTELENGALSGAALDVLANEPPDDDNPLLGLQNVVITPHMGGSTFESNQEKSLRAAKNVLSVYEGELPTDTVNTQGLLNSESVRGL